MMKAYSYLYSSVIDGSFVPHRIQNMVFRSYCSQRELEFCFGMTEVNLNGSWHSLNSLLEDSLNGSKLLFFSLSILKNRGFPYSKFIKKVKEKNFEIHFVSEDYILNTESDLDELNYFLENKRGKCVELLTSLHTATKRDYFARMSATKPSEMKISKKYDFDYWDGERKYGYGGYQYDGRWKPLAEMIIDKYRLTNESSVLDLGCGKAHLLFEIKRILPGISITGIDISNHAIDDAKEEVRAFLKVVDIREGLDFGHKEFDLAISLMVFHNFELPELEAALKEMTRVSKKSYLAVESYRNEEELCNLQCWALTCESFLSPREWEYLFDKNDYYGDYEFLFFTEE